MLRNPPSQTASAEAPAHSWRFGSDLETAGKEDLFNRGTGVQLLEQSLQIGDAAVRYVTGEFWTAGQRQANSIHEVSYRACFKPQLPAYFIKRFTAPGDVVYDPFSGRGTTAIEAALRGRTPIANDVNPLSCLLAQPRLACPDLQAIQERLQSISLTPGLKADIDLSMFYEAQTESEILSLRQYLRERREARSEDAVDAWIRMVATNRLTGHSSGFFSVYSFPPNQAVSQQSQRRINQQRAQTPEYRDTRKIILKKSRQLLKDVSAEDAKNLHAAAKSALFLTGLAGTTDSIPDESVQLTVTSPPFLDIVQYADDNWLRCWFNDLPTDQIARGISMARTVEAWSALMGEVFAQLYRITRRGGVVAFEVGEVRKGTVKLEEHVVPVGVRAGFQCQAVLVNSQSFTKTANIWGVSNNRSGTNSNRIVVFSKN